MAILAVIHESHFIFCVINECKYTLFCIQLYVQYIIQHVSILLIVYIIFDGVYCWTDSIKCLTDLKCDYTLSEEFRKTHYLAGLLLQEVKMCMNEPKEIRRHAIHLLRNQIAKHSFDDRYTSKVCKSRH